MSAASERPGAGAARAGPGIRPADWLRHALFGAIVAAYAVLAVLSPESLESLAQEDGPVEWLTFGFFAAASLAYGVGAWRGSGARRAALAALALLCLAVAGEEISWGQRLLGFMPPEAFLSTNAQQEANLHNLLHRFFQPKWLVVSLLLGWGAALPLLKRSAAGRLGALEPALQAACPPEDLLPWAVLGASLLVAYPVDFTGEYVELLAGALFHAAGARGLEGTRGALAALALPPLLAAAGWVATELPAAAGGAAKRDCAARETAALAAAIAAGGATEGLADKDSVHKRAFLALRGGYLTPEAARAVEAASCPGVAPSPLRRKYLLDPWGQPYWVRYRDEDEGERVLVYSFGPNRRRDSAEGASGSGDDVASSPLELEEAPSESGPDDDATLR